ncbi:hypothetical protein [Halobacillus sp. B23F22_1]|uniref:hypothetical protein n=1 Tax=Halobacillus sp. B23F22_1 TaxID=3459514 RepID=UPI00373FA044
MKRKIIAASLCLACVLPINGALAAQVDGSVNVSKDYSHILPTPTPNGPIIVVPDNDQYPDS